MSVTGSSYNINAINKLREEELKLGLEGAASWHDKYKNSAYVFIGGLPYGLTEGDVAIVFSQWGEPVDIHLVRDKKTGKSKGFAFVGYEDQRSTILAVDNANGMDLLGRRLRVDHVEKYRAPKPNEGEEDVEYKATGAEGAGIGVVGVTQAESIHDGMRREVEEKEKKKAAEQKEVLAVDEDEAWAAQFEKMLAEEKVKEEKEDKRNPDGESKGRSKRRDFGHGEERETREERRVRGGREGERNREDDRGRRRRRGSSLSSSPSRPRREAKEYHRRSDSCDRRKDTEGEGRPEEEKRRDRRRSPGSSDEDRHAEYRKRKETRRSGDGEGKKAGSCKGGRGERSRQRDDNGRHCHDRQRRSRSRS